MPAPRFPTLLVLVCVMSTAARGQSTMQTPVVMESKAAHLVIDRKGGVIREFRLRDGDDEGRGVLLGFLAHGATVPCGARGVHSLTCAEARANRDACGLPEFFSWRWRS